MKPSRICKNFSSWRQMSPCQVTRPSSVLSNWVSDSINPCPVQLPRKGLNWTDCCYCWPHHACWAGVLTCMCRNCTRWRRSLCLERRAEAQVLSSANMAKCNRKCHWLIHFGRKQIKPFKEERKYPYCKPKSIACVEQQQSVLTTDISAMVFLKCSRSLKAFPCLKASEHLLSSCLGGKEAHATRAQWHSRQTTCWQAAMFTHPLLSLEEMEIAVSPTGFACFVFVPCYIAVSS